MEGCGRLVFVSGPWILQGLALLAGGWPQEDGRLAEADRELLASELRRGKAKEVLEELDEVLAELPGDFATQSLRALARFELCDYGGALEDAEAALRTAQEAEQALPAGKAYAGRVLAELRLELGRSREALEALQGVSDALQPADVAQDAWMLGRSLLFAGERERAREVLRVGAELRSSKDWEELLAQARCQRALGRIQEAASTLQAADSRARKAGGPEPDVLVEWGELVFEAYGEVEDFQADEDASPRPKYEAALRLHPAHEGARMGLFELYRFNWRLSHHSPAELLEEMLDARPDSIRALLAQASASIDDGDLLSARQALKRLEELAPGRRDVRTQRAALLWIDHRRDEARAELESLAAEDAGDSAPEREVARHLVELYRFAEGLPFAEAAVKRDPRDWRAWKELGRARANTGDEANAFEALKRAQEAAEGRQDAWRRNTLMVLERMKKELVPYEAGAFRFLWAPESAKVLSTYFVPFYRDAREEVARRYGYTPDSIQVEVFHRWADFSVRSTGYEGFPALGVCFGGVVTAISPLSELRAQFSWARTAWHEFTHVVHLGLSHNRCPRWVTEGLATWEEGTRRSAWWRNSRRELLDARANAAIIPVRELNAAFRGPRILFAYFQSGLLCKMLIEEHGFGPLVRLLEAFDEGADLDRALRDVFGKTPEELDRAFLAFVDREITGLRIEPRWSKSATFLRSHKLEGSPPDDASERERLAWSEEWCRVAWGRYWEWQLGEKRSRTPPIEIEEALRLARKAGPLPARGLFLRGELEIAMGDLEAAVADFQAGFAAGGEDFRARMALATLLVRAEESSAAEEQYQAAELAFPGYDDPDLSAELRLAELYEGQGRQALANEARLRWLAFNADNYHIRVVVAESLDAEGRFAESASLWQEANEVDPFNRHLHVGWGRALARLERREEALREFDVALSIPTELDGDVRIGNHLAASGTPAALGRLELYLKGLGEDLSPEECAKRLLGRFAEEEPIALGEMAKVLVELGRLEEARSAIDRALGLDPDCASALEARARMP